MSAAPPLRVLVVDDEATIREALERALRLEGFVVDLAEGGTVALERLAAEPPDVVVLDVVMPDLDGIEVTRRLRGAGSRVPICILSARDEVADRVAGLRAGADDYLVKPFALEELTARLHALLRRTPSDDGVPIRVGDLTVDPARRLVRRGVREIELTNREFELLETLARHPGMVLSRTQLLEQVWGYTFEVDSNVVDVFVSYLRRKLEAGGESRLLHTVRGVGFVVRT
ncbi:MAG: response regulator transcription factor [Thermoleophilaceae bacterium]|jgi:two-component system response regulator PrrA|nr:response regulator transcription factor [Thermoleophilaceae bacterium]MBA3838859.1 response regulator transcription factor [Thermoleophilaceae bacterium]MDQ3240350.1 response regulator transcription factor [Actinomycetota bacterium]MDQ3320122.1 response regulator transcription factor [Actinomycetota bacterium]